VTFLTKSGASSGTNGANARVAVNVVGETDFVQMRKGLIHGARFCLHRVGSPFAVGLLDRLFDLGDGPLNRQKSRRERRNRSA